MSWRFNPPPGWPVPPADWTPPPDWAPDPSWPAPPPGWHLWVPAEDAPAGLPGQPPPGQGRRRRTWWVVGAAAAVVVVLGVVTTAVVLTRAGGEEDGPPAGFPGPTAIPTVLPEETDQPLNEVCDPPSWSGEINAEGVGPGRVSLDGVPDHFLFYVTYSYTPGDGQDFFQANPVVDGTEYGFIHHNQTGPVAGARVLRHRTGDQVVAELVINTQGTWTIRIQEFLAAPLWPEVTEVDRGSAVMRVEHGTLAGPVRVVADHDEYFSVGVYTDRPTPAGLEPVPEPLVSSDSAGTSDFVLPANTCLVSISAEGSWSLTLP